MELEGYLNARSSMSFNPGDRNVKTVLGKGTQGEILEAKKLSSGNYGLRIRVLNGVKADEVFWVYHKVSDSDLTLYESLPGTTSQPKPRQTAAVEEAQSVETRRPVQAHSAKANKDHVRPTPSPQDVVGLINSANDAVKKAETSSCDNCGTATAARERSLIQPGRKAMAKACNNLMNKEGELGPQGQDIMSVMSEPENARHLTANNALGSFCPKFNTLSDEDKLMAWAWFWTSLAMEESSCKSTQVHGTTYRDRNGDIQVLNPREGYGLWALERDRNVRRWRGDACSDIGNVEGQARCSIDIMIKTQLSQGRSAGVNSSSYWGPVRRGHRQLVPHMRRFSLCF